MAEKYTHGLKRAPTCTSAEIAAQMAPDVHAALIEILGGHGGLDRESRQRISRRHGPGIAAIGVTSTEADRVGHKD